MRRSALCLIVFLFLGLTAVPLHAQLADLEDTRTPEQKWARAMYIGDFAWISLVQLGNGWGMTAQEVGDWLGEFAAPSWGAPEPRSPQSFVRGMLMNYSLWDGFQFEILSETDTEVHGRMNIPYAGRFGESGEMEGVTLDEFIQFWTHAYEGTAERVGLDLEHRVNGEWIEFTVRTP